MKPDTLQHWIACQAAPSARQLAVHDGARDAALREALADQQFVLFYQPVMDQQRRMVGAEALIRWMHPRAGMVGPSEFIPHAEQSHLIVDIGDWVLQAACRQLVAWQRDEATCGFTVAVNISARQARQPDFVDRVMAIVTETRANPFLLKLELTESLLIGNVDDIVEKMHQLKAHGVVFGLDDFGTGYSSLSYLERLPVTHIKIDRSFVKNMLATPRAVTIVRTLIALARELDLEVVAEGVETQEQWAALVSFGCRRFQGYLFSAPVRVGALRKWFS
jgi:EAL domain-containing protein (putative c-di-GMP-specific phosphodiesterase class I)